MAETVGGHGFRVSIWPKKSFRNTKRVQWNSFSAYESRGMWGMPLKDFC